MKLAIKNIGRRIPSKKTGGTCITVILKDIDTDEEYKLYLDDTFQSTIKWLPHLKKGNVFDRCYTLQNPKFKNVIDSNSDFKLIREIEEKPVTERYDIEILVDGNSILLETINTDYDSVAELTGKIETLITEYRGKDAN